jgi:hypothetical protein
MPNNEIITCLEQKVILLTKVLDLTKQIQVRSRQPEIDLENFLEQRGSFMKRVQKCTDLVSSLTKQMPLEQQERLTRLFHFAVTEEGCNEEELLILTLSQKCAALLQQTASLDRSAYNAIKKQSDDAREKLSQLRKEGKSPSMFYNHR